MEEKQLIVDIEGVLLDLSRKGTKKTLKEVCENRKVSQPIIKRWGKRASKSVIFIYEFMEETGCTFEELVRKA
jgi:hypothetical protein